MSKTVYGSLCRIADLEQADWEIGKRDKDSWDTGDYVLGVVTGEASELYAIEETSGDMVPVRKGDRVVGALGNREATLEGVGTWRAVEDGKLDALTNAGLFGCFTSFSPLLPRPISLDYQGHVLRRGRKVRMRDFAMQILAHHFDVPTILIVGTSMSAGKTMTGKLACQELSKMGHRVIGAKLTGAGRYRDILSFREHGASEIYDFVDVGLPSTVVAEDQFRAAIRPLLSHISAQKPDFLVAEAGASPLEPYNGSTAVEELGDNIACRILCASDPYAVIGVQQAFGLTPDLVTGPATNTSAAIRLVRKLTGVHGINIIDPDAVGEFREFLVTRLGL